MMVRYSSTVGNLHFFDVTDDNNCSLGQILYNFKTDKMIPHIFGTDEQNQNAKTMAHGIVKEMKK